MRKLPLRSFPRGVQLASTESLDDTRAEVVTEPTPETRAEGLLLAPADSVETEKASAPAMDLRTESESSVPAFAPALSVVEDLGSNESAPQAPVATGGIPAIPDADTAPTASVADLSSVASATEVDTSPAPAASTPAPASASGKQPALEPEPAPRPRLKPGLEALLSQSGRGASSYYVQPAQPSVESKVKTTAPQAQTKQEVQQETLELAATLAEDSKSQVATAQPNKVALATSEAPAPAPAVQKEAKPKRVSPLDSFAGRGALVQPFTPRSIVDTAPTDLPEQNVKTSAKKQAKLEAHGAGDYSVEPQTVENLEAKSSTPADLDLPQEQTKLQLPHENSTSYPRGMPNSNLKEDKLTPALEQVAAPKTVKQALPSADTNEEYMADFNDDTEMSLDSSVSVQGGDLVEQARRADYNRGQEAQGQQDNRENAAKLGQNSLESELSGVVATSGTIVASEPKVHESTEVIANTDVIEKTDSVAKNQANNVNKANKANKAQAAEVALKEHSAKSEATQSDDILGASAQPTLPVQEVSAEQRQEAIREPIQESVRESIRDFMQKNTDETLAADSAVPKKEQAVKQEQDVESIAEAKAADKVQVEASPTAQVIQEDGFLDAYVVGDNSDVEDMGLETVSAATTEQEIGLEKAELDKSQGENKDNKDPDMTDLLEEDPLADLKRAAAQAKESKAKEQAQQAKTGLNPTSTQQGSAKNLSEQAHRAQIIPAHQEITKPDVQHTTQEQATLRHEQEHDAQLTALKQAVAEAKAEAQAQKVPRIDKEEQALDDSLAALKEALAAPSSIPPKYQAASLIQKNKPNQKNQQDKQNTQNKQSEQGKRLPDQSSKSEQRAKPAAQVKPQVSPSATQAALRQVAPDHKSAPDQATVPKPVTSAPQASHRTQENASGAPQHAAQDPVSEAKQLEAKLKPAIAPTAVTAETAQTAHKAEKAEVEAKATEAETEASHQLKPSAEPSPAHSAQELESAQEQSQTHTQDPLAALKQALAKSANPEAAAKLAQIEHSPAHIKLHTKAAQNLKQSYGAYAEQAQRMQQTESLEPNPAQNQGQVQGQGQASAQAQNPSAAPAFNLEVQRQAAAQAQQQAEFQSSRMQMLNKLSQSTPKRGLTESFKQEIAAKVMAQAPNVQSPNLSPLTADTLSGTQEYTLPISSSVGGYAGRETSSGRNLDILDEANTTFSEVNSPAKLSDNPSGVLDKQAALMAARSAAAERIAAGERAAALGQSSRPTVRPVPIRAQRQGQGSVATNATTGNKTGTAAFVPTMESVKRQYRLPTEAAQGFSMFHSQDPRYKNFHHPDLRTAKYINAQSFSERAGLKTSHDHYVSRYTLDSEGQVQELSAHEQQHTPKVVWSVHGSKQSTDSNK